MAPKPQARLIEKHTAIGLYSPSFCINIPMSKTISAMAPVTKNNWDIFFIWNYFVTSYQLPVTRAKINSRLITGRQAAPGAW
jgi:hypothetical protein